MKGGLIATTAARVPISVPLVAPPIISMNRTQSEIRQLQRQMPTPPNVGAIVRMQVVQLMLQGSTTPWCDTGVGHFACDTRRSDWDMPNIGLGCPAICPTCGRWVFPHKIVCHHVYRDARSVSSPAPTPAVAVQYRTWAKPPPPSTVVPTAVAPTPSEQRLRPKHRRGNRGRGTSANGTNGTAGANGAPIPTTVPNKPVTKTRKSSKSPCTDEKPDPELLDIFDKPAGQKTPEPTRWADEPDVPYPPPQETPKP